MLHPGDNWHGFDDIADDWCMLDPIKVSILTPGMGDDGKLEKSGVPAALVTAWLNRFGIVPTRVTDFQVMFLFSIGITKGKWGTLLTTCSTSSETTTEPSARRGAAGDRSAIPGPLPKRQAARPWRRAVRVLAREPSGRLLERCLQGLPDADMTPREAYERLVAGEVEPYRSTSSPSAPRRTR